MNGTGGGNSVELMSVTRSPANAPESQPFLLLCRSTLGVHVAAIAALAALLFLQRSEVFRHLSSHVLGGSERDAGLYLWLTELLPGSLGTLPWFATPAFYPYSLSLAWSDNFILPAVFAWLLRGGGLTPIAAYNVLILSAVLFAGYATFLLCLRLCGNGIAAFLAGAAFMSASFITAHLGHPQLQFVFWFPLGTLLLLRLVASPSLLRGAAAGCCISGAFLTTVYYAVFLAFLYALIGGLLFLLRPREMSKRFTAAAVLGMALPIAALFPFVLPYLSVQATFGERLLHEPYFFSASVLSYFSASHFNLLYSALSELSHSEGHLLLGAGLILSIGLGAALAFGAAPLRRAGICFLGALLFTCVTSIPGLLPGYEIALDLLCALGTWASALSLIWFCARLAYLERISGVKFLSNRAMLAVFLGAAFICLLVSFGPRGYSEGAPALSLYRLFYEGFPGFSAARAIGRIGIVVLFLLCVALGLSVSALQRRYNVPRWAFLALGALIVLEHAHTDYPLEEAPIRPRIFDSLAQHAGSGEAALVVPFAKSLTAEGKIASWSDFAQVQVNAMRFALGTGVPVINGYSGQRSKVMREWPQLLQDFPSAEGLRAAAEIAGLRWVVMLAPPDSQRLAEFSSKLRVVDTDAAGNVLIELLGSRLMDTDGAQLIVPSYPEGVVTIDLSVVPLPSKPEITISVLDRDSGLALASFGLPADGSWHTQSFRVGSSQLRVSPLRLLFQPTSSATGERVLYARKSLYEPGVPN